MAHDGNILEELLRELAIKKSGLAGMVEVAPNTVTNWIQADTIANDTLIKIGMALRHDLTQSFPRLKKIPEASNLNYFNADPNQVLEDLAVVKEAKAQYFKAEADLTLEINFLKERIDSFQVLIETKDALISSKEQLIESLNNRIKEFEKS